MDIPRRMPLARSLSLGYLIRLIHALQKRLTDQLKHFLFRLAFLNSITPTMSCLQGNPVFLRLEPPDW